MQKISFIFKFILILFTFHNIFIKSSIHVEGHIKISNELNTKKLTPLEILVDTTNNLGYKILHYHSISNRNNFAFSPTSLISVIIALYEGSNGRSYSELQNFLDLPRNKDISRIGLRDIHRRLRTYLFPQDNPLNGLSLSKENVTITAQYEAILKFYGYDLEFDMNNIPTFISELIATTVNDTVRELDESTEILPNVTTIMNMTLSDDSNNSNISPNNDEVEIIMGTTESITTTEIPKKITTTTEIITTETSELAAYVRNKINLNSNQLKRISDYWPTSFTLPIKNSQTLPPTTNNKNLSIKSNSQNRKGTSQLKSTRNKRFLLNEFFNKPHSFGNFHQFKTAFLNPFLINDGETYPSSIGGSEGFPHSILSHHTPLIEPINIPHFGINFDSSYLFPKETSLKNTINHIFYLNNQETIQTNYKTYNSILNYKYLIGQKITILELELNSSEYNLLIFLPDSNIDIDTAATYLKYIPSIRNLRKQLKPKWVQAIIPDLQLKGKIYLTNDLQNMGVKDIFEPSRADFSLMTNENDIYVKHIEQIINVNIRTHPVDQLKGVITQQIQPIEVAVNHPFLFFIVDKEIDVTILAGRALNPLNLRIQ